MDNDMAVAAFLIGCFTVAISTDFLYQKIPNWLILITGVGGIVGNSVFDQVSGMLFSISGLFTGLMCFLPLYVFGRMGAGDVKLLAAVGAVVGPGTVLTAALMTILAGGLLALAYITVRGGLPALLRRYSSMFVLLTAQQPQYIPPAPGEAAGLRFPYALAIACGTALAII